MRRLLLIFGLLLIAPLSASARDASLDAWRSPDPSIRREALQVARSAFDAFSRRREVIRPPSHLSSLFKRRVGIFVSTMRGDAPRTCMGTLYPMQPNAALEIIASAAASAGADRRFSPVKPSELSSLKLIVSIVGVPQPISKQDLRSLDPIREGLVVKSGDRRGVVLSGETDEVDRMVRWGRIRAGVQADAPVELYRLDVVRFMEGGGR